MIGSKECNLTDEQAWEMASYVMESWKLMCGNDKECFGNELEMENHIYPLIEDVGWDFVGRELTSGEWCYVADLAKDCWLDEVGDDIIPKDDYDDDDDETNPSWGG